MTEMTVERALAGGDLSGLTDDQRAQLVQDLCRHLGFNPLTTPFGFFRDDTTGVLKTVIRKSGIEQLRQLRGLCITDMHVMLLADVVVYILHGNGTLPDTHGVVRKEVASGTMSLEGLHGAEKAKAFLLAETKAKSRLTLALAGIGIGEEPDVIATLARQAAEPVRAAEPQVNQAPAIVIQDSRSFATTPYPPPGPSTAEVMAAGVTIQAIIDRGHHFPEPEPEKMAAEMDKPTPSPQNEAVAKALPKPVVDEGGFGNMFGDDPVPTPEEPRDDRPNFGNVPYQPLPGFTPIAPLVVGTPVQMPDGEILPVLASGPSPFEEFLPPPVVDSDPKPTPVEFKAFTARCTKLVRDVLPKAGKEAPGLLLPFLKKTFGTNEIQTATVKLWESTLTRIETASTPADRLAILKGR